MNIAGSAVLAGRYAQEIIRRLPGEEVDIEYSAEEKMIYIKSNRSRFSILSMEAEDYPTVTKFEGQHNFQISDVTLRDLIVYTSFACSADEARPVFTGCLMDLQEEKVTMVATNTHRMAIKSDRLEDFHGNQRMIIPGKLLNELSKVLQSDMQELSTLAAAIPRFPLRWIMFIFPLVLLMANILIMPELCLWISRLI